MCTPHGIFHCLKALIDEKYGPSLKDDQDTSTEDREIAEKMLELIHGLHSKSTSLETITTLDFGENDACEDERHEVDSMELASPDIQIGLDTFTLDYMKKSVRFYDTEGWKSVQKNCRRVKHRNYISRFKKYIENNGTRQFKQKATESKVYERFMEALGRREILHDYDLRKLGVEAARSVGLTTFKASSFWVHQFKKKFKIVSRKINKFVTKISDEDSSALLSLANEFVDEVKALRAGYNESHIFNSDQSGFNYILKSSRMHAICGEKTVIAHTESNFKQTHSYTIQPLLSLSGDLLGKLLIVMQETGDSFGPRVQLEVDELMKSCKNVVVRCSKSGKMSKELVKDWIKNCVKPIVSEKCLLIVDSWKGQKSEDLFHELDTYGCARKYIPEKTTHICQPLDVYGFRQWKNIVRKLCAHCWLYNFGIDIGSRHNIIKMQSLVMNQLSAPIFKAMWKYSWWKSGYTEEHPGSFESTNEVMFPVSMNTCDLCDTSNFVKCAHCRKYLCFKHFFVDFHYHDDNDMSQAESQQ